MTLELNEEDSKDLQTIIMFALRYAQGRKTYAFNIVSAWIISNYDLMQQWQLKQMGEEIESDIGLWDLSDSEKQHYLEVASELKELSKDDFTRKTVRTNR